MIKVLIAAGGTGGHLFPAQQLAELLKSDSQILFAGHKLAISPFFAKEKIDYCEIPAASLAKPLAFIWESAKGLLKSLVLMARYKPDVVVGFGSFHSFPVLLAAALLRKKIVLFEANPVLGKVNRLFLPVAKQIALQFHISLKKGVFVPLLPWVQHSWKGTKEEARRAYGLDPHKNTILVFGGSQGASFLNETMPQAARGLDFQILHLTGKGGKADYASSAAVMEFESEMGRAYAAADLVVCRSGAGTLAELIRMQKPALLVPYPFAADDHQRLNGQYLVEKVKGARMLLQKEATPQRVVEEIHQLWTNREEYEANLRAVKQEERVDFGTIVRQAAQ